METFLIFLLQGYLPENYQAFTKQKEVSNSFSGGPLNIKIGPWMTGKGSEPCSSG